MEIEKIRHSLAHLLAAAVLEMYPDAQVTLGPAIDTGFYYDFYFPTNKPGEEDLPKIEEKMREILPTWDKFEEKEVSKEEALKIFKDNPFKKELVEEIVNKGEKINLYTSGNFTDLCRGGHVDSMKDINLDGFKLSSIAGAYWRGDENNQMLTRIYGIAFENKEELEEHKQRLEEAANRDHRKIGKEMDLFTFSDKVGAGLPMFTPKGQAMRNAIVNKIYSIQKKYGFEEVWIPHMTKKDLYETSGHWEKFEEELLKIQGKETEFVMKPMNCPHHTQIYASSQKSYRDLPVRYMETTTCYRDEQTGELLGLSRVRSLTQDDGHVFCTPDQTRQEIENIIQVVKEFYTSLDMWKEGGFKVFLSVRDPKNLEKYIGDYSDWENSEKALKEIAEENNLPYKIEEGEAAFYGPKLDFMFKDAIGREWQLATIQLDFNMPKRFELEYTDKDGSKKTPVMIHRAVAGSLERFMAVIIEHFAGNFPVWLAPVQAKILPISEAHLEYAEKVLEELKEAEIRVKIDTSSEQFGKKVRKAKVEKVPYFLVIGDKEIEEKKVTIESRDGEPTESLTVEESIKKIRG